MIEIDGTRLFYLAVCAAITCCLPAGELSWADDEIRARIVRGDRPERIRVVTASELPVVAIDGEPDGEPVLVPNRFMAGGEGLAESPPSTSAGSSDWRLTIAQTLQAKQWKFK